ncbi:glycosyltransferase [Streptomyces sp. NPDC058664]|uniref:glycosyltransferase n=1 Tax=unclassified Streptomyces TaxID=2593676 RepID=UPI003657D1F9
MKILLCPLSDGGYLYPAIAAGRELRRRGHHVGVLGRSTAGPFATEAGLPFAAAEDFGGRRAFSATWWGKTGPAQYRATLRAARDFGADLLVTSVLCNGALLAAEELDVPVVVIGLSVHLWDYRSGGGGEPHLGRTRRSRTLDCRRIYAATREETGLEGRASRWQDDPLSGDALLLRGDPDLEYPGAELPGRVRHVGPLDWEPTPDPAEVAAVGDHLARSGKPVVYVHLGRFFGGRSLWPRLNEIFTGGRFQAVVEQGRSTDPRPAPGADILLVRRPWMGPFVDLAGMVLANGTSAPVLAALVRGRPLALSPNGSEQPLLTGACVRAGVAVRVPHNPSADPSTHPPAGLSTHPSALLERAWRDDGLRSRARALGVGLAAQGGAARAADIVERVARASVASPTTQASATPKEDHEYATSRPR